MPDVKKAGDEHTKLYSLLAYVLGWLSGVVAIILAGNDKTVKFHGIQSIILSVVSMVLMLPASIVIGAISIAVPLAALCLPFIWIVGLVFWVAGMYVGYNAYSEKNMKMKLPIIGDFAEKLVG
ncbi:hypothetical protein HY992_01425 [Candidatus Micrarchaeota archaeon]|nr:hypothetical protein [Candidatus Micrarchaeota archaeon]